VLVAGAVLAAEAAVLAAESWAGVAALVVGTEEAGWAPSALADEVVVAGPDGTGG
jgi:hypothetical protein